LAQRLRTYTHTRTDYKMRAAYLLMLATCLSPITAQLDFFNKRVGGTYLPPQKDDQCVNKVETSIVTEVVTTSVAQPLTIDRTSTTIAQSIATTIMAVTTTLE
ncbi:unnamed protein product, partial [Meganyctiphanes norvegica]